MLSTAALLPVPFRNLPALSLSGHWGLLNFYLHLPTNSENNEENSPKKGQQRSREILEQGAAAQMMQREQAGCVCVCKEDSAQHGGGTQNRLWVPCVVLPSSVRKKIQRGTQNVCCLFVRLSPPGSLHLVPCNQGCALRKGWGAANQTALAREGEIRSRRDPTMSCSCFCYTTKLQSWKMIWKARGCAGITDVSCLWALGTVCVNGTFFPPILFWMAVERKSNNCTRMSWGQGQNLTFQCCNSKHGVYFNVETACEKTLSFVSFF